MERAPPSGEYRAGVWSLTMVGGSERCAEHVAALSDALSEFGRSARMGIEEMNDLQDANSADLLTAVSRSIDQWLWFVEAHLDEGRGT